MTDFSSMFATDFNSFGMPMRLCRIVPMIVILFSKAQDAKEIDVKHRSIEMLISSILQ